MVILKLEFILLWRFLLHRVEYTAVQYPFLSYLKSKSSPHSIFNFNDPLKLTMSLWLGDQPGSFLSAFLFSDEDRLATSNFPYRKVWLSFVFFRDSQTGFMVGKVDSCRSTPIRNSWHEWVEGKWAEKSWIVGLVQKVCLAFAGGFVLGQGNKQGSLWPSDDWSHMASVVVMAVFPQWFLLSGFLSWLLQYFGVRVLLYVEWPLYSYIFSLLVPLLL